MNRPKVIQIAVASPCPEAADSAFIPSRVYVLYDDGEVYCRYTVKESEWIRFDLPRRQTED